MSLASTPAAFRVRDAAPLFAALGDETRLRLLLRLSRSGPGSITQLTEGSDVTRQAITKHLEALREAGLVKSQRRGRERVWELRPDRLITAHQYLERISQRWDEALERLRRFVEE